MLVKSVQLGRDLLGHQFVRYFISGGSAVLLHWLILIGLVELFAVSPMVATAIGFVVGFLLNYSLLQSWVFETSGNHRLFLMRYVVVTCITFVLNMGLFWLLYESMSINYSIAQVIATGVVFLVNFLINRSFTFNE